MLQPGPERGRGSGRHTAAAALQCRRRRCGELRRDWRDCRPRDRTRVRRAGRRFDGSGAERNCWTVADEQAFASISGALAAQFNAYSPIEGAHVNGFVTLRENIGDLSGLAIAWRVYKIS
jgi:hypothetical protein